VKRNRQKQGSRVTLLEIGVNTGGSIDMYKSFFGSSLRYVGIDLNPETAQVAAGREGQVNIHIGSQSDPTFLRKVVQHTGAMFDVVIDDGSHIDELTIASFLALWKNVSPDRGIYIVEDLQKAELFRRFTAQAASQLHSLYTKHRPLCRLRSLSNFCQEAYRITQYHCITVFEKLPTTQPDGMVKYGRASEITLDRYLKADWFKKQKLQSSG